MVYSLLYQHSPQTRLRRRSVGFLSYTCGQMKKQDRACEVGHAAKELVPIRLVVKLHKVFGE